MSFIIIYGKEITIHVIDMFNTTISAIPAYFVFFVIFLMIIYIINAGNKDTLAQPKTIPQRAETES